MTGEASLPQELFVLSLLASVAVIGYLLFKSRRELGRYKLIFDEMLLKQNLLPYLKLDEKLNIISSNLAAQDSFQLAHQTVNTTPFARILPAVTRERILRIYRKRLALHGRLLLRHQVSNGEDSIRQGQWLIFRDPGSLHYHAFFRVESEGNPVIVKGIHMQLTDEKDRSLGKEIHHELMNKLASVMGYSELIRSSEKAPGKIKDFAGEVITAAEQIRLLLQPSDNAKISDLFMNKIAGKYNLTFTGDPAIPLGVSSSVLETAIASVIEFMRKEGNGNGERSITTLSKGIESCSACAGESDETSFVVTMTDTGLHVDREHLKYLLTPGFVTAAVGDTINLLQVSDLMHKHGGHIRLTIGASGFSTTLLFPATTMIRPIPVRTKKGGNNILIIDDELAVAGFLKEVIQQAGYNVTVFTDPAAALAQFKGDPGRFDLVITDQMMPGISGDVVMRTMLAQRPDLPIIMCTGYSDSVDANVALELGAVGYVTKPVKVSRLVEIVRHALAAPAS